MKIKILVIAILVSMLLGCGLPDSFMRAQRMPTQGGGAPMVFGGVNRDIYLGNISDHPADMDSIYNPSGKYGDPNSEFSIRNTKSDYGSKTSNLSACNPDAFNPPIIVDRYNMVVGVFTLNESLKSTLPPAIIDPLRKLCK